jgi:hypothetical protein
MQASHVAYDRLLTGGDRAMPEITAPVMRSVITDDEFGGFRITIRPTVGTRLAFWCALAVWGIGVLLTLRSIVNSPARLTLEGIKPLGFWLAIGVFIWFFAVFKGIIREVIKIEGKSLILRKELAVFSKDRIFQLVDVRNLRPMRWNDDSHGSRRPDTVAFDHKGRTYHFGAGLSEQEVLRLIKTIRLKFAIREDWSEVEPLPVVK